MLVISGHHWRHYKWITDFQLQRTIAKKWTQNKKSLLQSHSISFGCQTVELNTSSWNVLYFSSYKFNHSHRLVDGFNAIYNYFIASYFLWGILSISSTLLVLQIQLVEYIFIPCDRMTVDISLWWCQMVLRMLNGFVNPIQYMKKNTHVRFTAFVFTFFYFNGIVFPNSRSIQAVHLCWFRNASSFSGQSR